MEEDSRVIYIEIPTSKTPSTPSPCRERGIGFFDIITRRFGRRSHDDLNCYQNHGDEDSRSSSTDSCSSTSDRLTITTTKTHRSNLEISCSSDSSSNSSNNSSGNDNIQNSTRRHHRRSTSSLRKALQSLSISPRSLSCSGGDLDNAKDTSSIKQKKSKKQQAPKRILRQPVTYTYLKGISGLPTQRVPKSSVCCHHMRR